jgi:transcriptional regulator with XRE-family HTH domain
MKLKIQFNSPTLANMRIDNQNSDTSVLEELGQRLAQARLARNLKQDELATAAGLSKRTIERLEAGGSVQLSNFIRALRALELLQNLEPLVPATGLARLKPKQRARRRVSPSPKPAAQSGEPAAEPFRWSWGDKK